MSKYSWDEFKNSEYFDELIDGFEKIEEEIGSDKVVVFISRRSFCLFLLLKKRGFLNEWEQYEIYSDRLLIKNMDPEFLEGRDIVLIDDTICTGSHMKECLDIIKDHINAASIQPIVFVSDNNKKWKEKKELEDVRFLRTYTESQMLELASIESLLFYQEGIPYVAELPVMTDGNQDSDTFEIILSEEEFVKLTASNEKWEYQEYRQLGYEQNEVISSVMILKNHILKRCMPELISDMVVRMQWIEKEDGIHLTMIPFAILKSIHFDDLYDVFSRFFDKTDYKKQIECTKLDMQCKNKNFNEFAYIAIYRAVVYGLSYFIAEEAMVWAYKVINRPLGIGRKADRYYYSKTFCNSINSIFDLKNKHENIYKIINWVAQKEVSYRKYIVEFGRDYLQRTYTKERAYLFLLELMNDKRHKAVWENGAADEMLTIEEINYMFNAYLLREQDVNTDGYICGLICSMLNQGNLVNELSYDSCTGIVYRGFHAGENSDAFYKVSAKIFCSAVLKFRECVGERYLEVYDDFAFYLYDFCDTYDLWKNYITHDEFAFYKKYFKMAREEQFSYQLNNKEFLIKDNIPFYLKMVRDYVESLDFTEDFN